MSYDNLLVGTVPTKLALYAALFASGAGGLTWEILWQHHSALLLGVSTYGTAITLSSLMGGLGTGAFLASRFADRIRRPLLAYAIAEVVVGIGGLLVVPGMTFLATVDPVVYAWSPSAAWVVQIAGTGALIMVPATAMGATLPLLAPCARDLELSMARLYAANTGGAVIGILIASFLLLPLVGVRMTSFVAAAVDVLVAGWALFHVYATIPLTESEQRSHVSTRMLWVAFYSGLALFMLEVAWFRSLRAAFQSSTESFAIVLAAFILPLALSAAVMPRFANRRGVLPWLFLGAGFFVLSVTPFIDRMDEWITSDFYSPASPARRFLASAAVMALPVALAGGVFPTLLARHGSSTDSGRLFAFNTLGAIVGTLLAGFVALPAIGATRTGWMVATSMFVVGISLAGRRKAVGFAFGLAAAGVALAFTYYGGSARDRVQGFGLRFFNDIVFVSEGPDSTVWVAHDNRSGTRKLIIDGFEASGEHQIGEHYMRWMGHLPALAVDGPIENALVICFGTGQTAHAVRQHDPRRLDIADVNSAVLEAAPLFSSNHDVLDDPIVHEVVMDGRKFLQRHPGRDYDVITLEPMPPNFAGTNNLYSREFYELARSRMTPRGIIAQWLPLHIIADAHMKAILASFVDVFPHAKLWIDPVGGTGIVVGGALPWEMHSPTFELDLDTNQIQSGFLLDRSSLQRLIDGSDRVTDDNQILAYGLARLTRSVSGRFWFDKLYKHNLGVLHDAAVPRVSQRR